MRKQSKQDIKKLIASKSRVFLDLGCAEWKHPGSIGVDIRDVEGVDIVQDLSVYPWTNIPDECADTVFTYHFLEHINPDPANPQLAGLIDLMLDKKLVTKKEVEGYVGDYRFMSGMVRFMNEVWRILKPGGQMLNVLPYAGAPGYWQDPSHLNPVTHVTFAYFDPQAQAENGAYYDLYKIYRPLPWKIVKGAYDHKGLIENALEKRVIDPSYNVILDPNGLETNNKIKKS